MPKFTKEDFTNEQLMILKMAFTLVENVIEMQRENNYDVLMCNELYYLKDKLGIYELVDELQHTQYTQFKY